MFLAVLLPAAVALCWLGFRLLEQDRLLLRQRDSDRQAAAADGIVRSLSQILSDTERQIADGTPPPGALLMTRGTRGLEAEPARLLAWTPMRVSLPNIPDEPFDALERLEFRGRADEALPGYARLAGSADPAVRAGALLRRARVMRRSGRPADAVDVYRQLTRVSGVAFEGVPVDLVARRALCDVLQELGRQDALQAAARDLETDFEHTRWLLDRSTWELVADDLRRWSSHPAAISTERVALSELADWFAQNPGGGADRRFVRREGGMALTIVRQEPGADAAAIVLPPTVVERWLGTATAALPPGSLHVALVDEHGAYIAGDAVPHAAPIVRAAAESGLPWTLIVEPGPAWPASQELQGRERLVRSGLIVLALFLAGGAYLLWRVVQREVAVAQLQSEFVSAVSHEFRTPLTSLQHVAELLQDDEEHPRETRVACYDVLTRNTERLHRLVESLLDFGRMEEARKPYDLRPVELAAFVSSVVDDFRADPVYRGRPITFSAACSATVRADAAALGHALWNLLDNAVKYSPPPEPVQVSVVAHPRGVAIAVSDRGLGIPGSERRDVFGKFVRGREAVRRGITGTGLGLAIVRHIVDAHGGAIELDSEEGYGSTFRVVLPEEAA